MLSKIVIAGSGGNVGSHLVPLLARLPEVGSLVLIDPDTYEEKNLLSQQIHRDHVSRPKVQVQADQLHNIRPDLEVIPWQSRLEDLPLGELRGDLVISCLDSRLARQHLNARVLALGLPMLDSGVDGSGMQWQVSFFNPKETTTCLECTWQDGDYELLEQVHACGEGLATAPTNATAALGSMAASYIAMKCQEFLLGTIEPRQFFSRQSRMLVGPDIWRSVRYQPNSHCRAPEHEPWEITPLSENPDQISVSEALALGDSHEDNTEPAILEVPGHSFHLRLTCAVCEKEEPRISLFINPDLPLAVCPDCAEVRFTTGDDLREELTAEIMGEEVLKGSLAKIGLRPGEVFRTTRGESVWHFELPVDPTRRNHHE